jgi:hypothetical protein
MAFFVDFVPFLGLFWPFWAFFLIFLGRFLNFEVFFLFFFHFLSFLAPGANIHLNHAISFSRYMKPHLIAVILTLNFPNSAQN